MEQNFQTHVDTIKGWIESSTTAEQLDLCEEVIDKLLRRRRDMYRVSQEDFEDGLRLLAQAIEDHQPVLTGPVWNPTSVY